MNKDSIRSLVREMFGYIDGREFDSLRLIFHNNCKYKRPGYVEIAGIDNLLNFYKNIRIIKEGVHVLDQIIVEDEYSCAFGTFIGKNKNNEDVDIRFADKYQANQEGKILIRETFFFKPAV